MALLLTIAVLGFIALCAKFPKLGAGVYVTILLGGLLLALYSCSGLVVDKIAM